MTFRHASDVPLTFGGNTVWLRPSLRAAMRLEALHGGFPALLIKIQQFDTATVRAIIIHAATDRVAAQTVMAAMAGASLRQLHQATLAPAFALIAALMTPDTHKDQGEAAKAPTGKAVAWADLYADLYQIATGWLGWSPETAWNATLAEITQAFEGHTDKLKAIHGSADDNARETSGTSIDQRQANIDSGLDPDFDRAGLHALKARHTG